MKTTVRAILELTPVDLTVAVWNHTEQKTYIYEPCPILDSKLDPQRKALLDKEIISLYISDENDGFQEPALLLEV